MASIANDGLWRQQRHEFRKMARHPEIVEQVIADSNDDDPPTRRKVMRAIAEHEGRQPERRCVCPDCGAAHRRRTT